MNSSAPSGQDSATDSGPFTLELILGILTLVLGLPAAPAALIKVYQARAARVRKTDTESQTSIELSIISTTEQAPAQVPANAPAATVSRR